MKIALLAFVLLSFATLGAQTNTDDFDVTGQLVTEDGDTLLLADLDGVSITSPRSFASRQERYLYKKYTRYCGVVWPIAQDAIEIFEETQHVTATYSKRQRRKHIRRLQKDLKENFEDKLKNLTKLQGKILVKMIEKELDTPMHYLIKDLRGGMTATYWTTFASFYGYKLKDGYRPGEDPLLDMVLSDFELVRRDKK